ncbi:MAG: glycosyltransferase family 4 protein [Candidatus Margulisiibacteriota bacterium]|jgi:glycosyltransferase involved in cell wall biosynthesis
MRIVILSEAFPPETKSASTLFFELAASLVKRGHQVSVITRMPRYNVADGTDLSAIPAREKLAGVEVRRFRTPPLARTVPLIRGFEHFILGWIFFWGGLFMKRPDLILVYSPPLPLGVTGFWLGKIKRCPVVVNIQDLYPQTVIDLGLLKNKMLIGVSRRMERFIYRQSDAITVHSLGNREYVRAHGARDNLVEVVHNWVDIDEIKPAPKGNDFSRKHGLGEKFVVSFAGVMGFAQGLEVVIGAADILRNEKNMLFVLVGDGVKKAELEGLVKEKKLANVLFVPTQPLKIYPQILHASDLCLVTLKKDLATPVVPGKMLSIMAAGKPVVASLPLQGDAPKILAEFNCGLAVEPDNSGELAAAIRKLYNDSSLREIMGKNGRQGAETAFSREHCVTSYEKIFKAVLSRRK